MNQSPRFEIAEVTLTPVSPIHISAGNPNHGCADIEYNNSIYIIDEEKLAQRLERAQLLDEYVQFMIEWTQKNVTEDEYNNRSDFKRDKKIQANILRTFLLNNLALIAYRNETIEQAIQSIAKFKYPATNSSHFIRNGDNNAFIPGTSLKGVLRTALMWDILKNNSSWLNNYVQQRLQTHNEKEGLSKELLNWIFQDHSISDGSPNSNNVEPGSITDFMKAIQVTDSTIIPDDSITSSCIQVVTLDRNRQPQKKPFDIEKELYNDQLKNIMLKITLDKTILNSFVKNSNSKGYNIPFSNLVDVIKILKEFGRKVWFEEQRFFSGYTDKYGKFKPPIIQDKLGLVISTSNFYNQNIPDNYCYIRIGYGSGLLGTTMFPLLNFQNRQDIRNLIKNRYNQPAPKSRRLVFYSNQHVLPLGWARLQFSPAINEFGGQWQ